MTGSANAGERAAAMNRRLEQLAAEGDWQQVAATMPRRDSLLALVPAAEREAALLSARRSTDRLRSMATAAKALCAGELATLKRGRQAAASYRAHR